MTTTLIWSRYRSSPSEVATDPLIRPSHERNSAIGHRHAEAEPTPTPSPLVYENNGVADAWASKSLSYKDLGVKS